MTPTRDDVDDDCFLDIVKSKKSIKEDILDETFKKAEISKGLRPKDEKRISEKPFRKLGIVLIIIAVVSLLIINYLPWMYIRYESEYGPIEEFYYKGFNNREGDYYNEVYYVFESPCTNCSNNSKNFIGIIEDDFTNIPNIASSGFITLIFLGIIFTIFEIIEKKLKLSIEIPLLIHSTFAAIAIFVSIIIAISSIKFLGVYFLLYYNMPFIEASGVNNVILLFLVPIILIIISFAIIKVTLTVMKINIDEFVKKLKSDRSYSLFSKSKQGKEI